MRFFDLAGLVTQTGLQGVVDVPARPVAGDGEGEGLGST
jgi:hypothetical protein